MAHDNTDCSRDSFISDSSDVSDTDSSLHSDLDFTTPKKRKYQRQLYSNTLPKKFHCLTEIGNTSDEDHHKESESFGEDSITDHESIGDESIGDESIGDESSRAESLSATSDTELTDDSSSTYEEENKSKDEPLFPGSIHTRRSSCLSVMMYVSKHSLDGEAFADLLSLMASHMPKSNKFVNSVYKTKEFLKRETAFQTPVRKFICNNCNAFMDESQVCGNEGCQQNEVKPYEFFDLNLDHQLKELFKDEEVCKYVLTDQRETVTHYSDITDGQEYQRHMKMSPAHKLCTLTMNTDGVALFNSSSKGSLWPVYLAINELPVKMRYSKKYLLTSHLYCQREKPNMLAYLVPLMQILKKLHTEGMMIQTTTGATFVRFRLLAVALDLPAKAMVLNSKQFNGKFGCSYCFEEGVSPPNAPMLRYYPFQGGADLRSHQSVVDDARMAVKDGKPVHGIKGASVLLSLSYFDVTKDVVIDWMHCVLLGVVKSLLGLWMSSENKAKPFYIGDKKALVNERLRKVKVPGHITRLQKDINDYSKWKASECREWLFHYSIPVLTDVLEPELLVHFALLVTGVFILNKDIVSVADIDFAEGCLRDFCKLFPHYYDDRKQTMNLHLLLHLARFVRLHGPLFNYSCFGFESMNSHIKKMVHGTRYVNDQICFAISMGKSLPDLVSRMMKDSVEEVRSLIHRLNNTLPNEGMDTYIQGLGKKKRHATTAEAEVWKYHRVQSHIGLLYCTEYKRTSDKMSCDIMYEDGDEMSFGQVQYFLQSGDGLFASVLSCTFPVTPLLDFVNVTNTSLRAYRDLKLCAHMTKIDEGIETTLVPVHKIKHKCISIECLNSKIVSIPPNYLEHS